MIEIQSWCFDTVDGRWEVPSYSIPVGRYGTPDDNAAVVKFLASEEASFSIGAVIDVNGGSRMN